MANMGAMTKVKQPSDCGLAYAQPPPEVNLSHALTPHRGIQCELGGHDRGYRYQLLAGHHVTRHGDVSATIDVKAEGDGESILALFKGFHTAIPQVSASGTSGNDTEKPPASGSGVNMHG